MGEISKSAPLIILIDICSPLLARSSAVAPMPTWDRNGTRPSNFSGVTLRFLCVLMSKYCLTARHGNDKRYVVSCSDFAGHNIVAECFRTGCAQLASGILVSWRLTLSWEIGDLICR